MYLLYIYIVGLHDINRCEMWKMYLELRCPGLKTAENVCQMCFNGRVYSLNFDNKLIFRKENWKVFFFFFFLLKLFNQRFLLGFYKHNYNRWNNTATVWTFFFCVNRLHKQTAHFKVLASPCSTYNNESYNPPCNHNREINRNTNPNTITNI